MVEATPFQTTDVETAAKQLAQFLRHHPKALVIGGAGLSAGSGIPTYRDREGKWTAKPPVDHREYMAKEYARQRYWARSLVGWPQLRDTQPSQAHLDLTALQQHGWIGEIITQNVDRLHQKSGSHAVIDLHGRADQTICMSCAEITPRDETHQRCAQLNPAFTGSSASPLPDGDAMLERDDFDQFITPRCLSCGGILKTNVVFFGDNLPILTRQQAEAAVDSSPALVLIGSSMMVYSGFRLCKRAAANNKPIAILTLGRTRADDLASLKMDCAIEPVLEAVRRYLAD